MKRSIIAFISLVQSFFVFGQDATILNADSLLADLEILTTTIRENHPMMPMYTTGARFDNLALRTSMQLKTGVSAPVFYSSISRLISSVGCGHTYAYPMADMEARMKEIQDLPVEVVFVDSSLYVSAAHLEEYRPYVGQEIVSINDVPITRLITVSFQHISADGLSRAAKAYGLEQNFNFYLNLILGSPGTLYFETSGGTFSVGFPTDFTKPVKEDLSAGFHELPEVPGTVVLSLPDFDAGKPVIKSCFNYMQKEHIENLIIDLRDNRGGSGNIGDYLISFVIDSTLTYYLDKKVTPMRYKEYLHQKEGIIVSNKYIMTDSLTRSYYFNIKPRKKCNFNGHVYVMTNGGTFSTGSFAASVLKNAAGATVVGQETGGSEYAIGGGVIGRLVLPYSGLNVRFPLYKWRFNVMEENSGRGVVPDSIVRPDPKTMLLHTDQVLARVIELVTR
ncbi:MAG TPA: S41 family peptidase [Saprospiraceae bacterium]|nr:S41 family peptidase [Saprospiraceae bacterium]